jgi:hypothetical protein
MNRLVQKFQERLEVSRKTAMWRVIEFFIILFCTLAAISLAIILFPYAGGFTEKFPLLPGNRIQVAKILDGDVLVEDENEFLRLAEKNVIFFSLGGNAIEYMTKVSGISYRYDQTIPLSSAYFVFSKKVTGNQVIRKIKRSLFYMIFVHIVLPLLILFVLFLLFVDIQQKRVSGWGKDTIYRQVWL